MVTDLFEMVRTATTWFGPSPTPSGAPRASRDSRLEAPQIGHGHGERALLLRAAIRRHQYLHDSDAVVEGEPRRLLAEKRAGEVPVLRLVAVRHGLSGDHRHHAGLGILLLDEI